MSIICFEQIKEAQFTDKYGKTVTINKLQYPGKAARFLGFSMEPNKTKDDQSIYHYRELGTYGFSDFYITEREIERCFIRQIPVADNDEVIANIDVNGYINMINKGPDAIPLSKGMP